MSTRTGLLIALVALGLLGAACEGGDGTHTAFHSCGPVSYSGPWIALDLYLDHQAPNCPIYSWSTTWCEPAAGDVYDYHPADADEAAMTIFNGDGQFVQGTGAEFYETYFGSGDGIAQLYTCYMAFSGDSPNDDFDDVWYGVFAGNYQYLAEADLRVYNYAYALSETSAETILAFSPSARPPHQVD